MDKHTGKMAGGGGHSGRALTWHAQDPGKELHLFKGQWTCYGVTTMKPLILLMDANSTIK
jgi:hypothetical protein